MRILIRSSFWPILIVLAGTIAGCSEHCESPSGKATLAAIRVGLTAAASAQINRDKSEPTERSRQALALLIDRVNSFTLDAPQLATLETPINRGNQQYVCYTDGLSYLGFGGNRPGFSTVVFGTVRKGRCDDCVEVLTSALDYSHCTSSGHRFDGVRTQGPSILVSDLLPENASQPPRGDGTICGPEFWTEASRKRLMSVR
jgi:hypothetical protein